MRVCLSLEASVRNLRLITEYAHRVLMEVPLLMSVLTVSVYYSSLYTKHLPLETGFIMTC